MDFEVFGKSDIETLFEHTLEHLPESAKEAAIKEFGSVEQWKAHYMEGVYRKPCRGGISETGRMVWEQRGGSRCRYGAAKPGIGSGFARSVWTRF